VINCCYHFSRKRNIERTGKIQHTRELLNFIYKTQNLSQILNIQFCKFCGNQFCENFVMQSRQFLFLCFVTMAFLLAAVPVDAGTDRMLPIFATLMAGRKRVSLNDKFFKLLKLNV